MKITRENGEFIIKIPDTEPRYNPYDEQEVGTMDSLVGLIFKRHGIKEYTLANRIDMDYKGKGDQCGQKVIIIDNIRTDEDFTKLCNELNIDIFDYSHLNEPE